jgi:uncharacterized membrane protein
MNRKSSMLTCLYIMLLCLVTYPAASYAYIGPGAGLSAIGALLALVATVAVAIFGFIWYPIKRLARKRKKESQPQPNVIEEQEK